MSNIVLLCRYLYYVLTMGFVPEIIYLVSCILYLVSCILYISMSIIIMQRHDVNAFWKDIRKHTKSKSALSYCIDGITGEAGISDMWVRHYEQLLNDSSSETSKITVLNSFRNVRNS